jgi:hypothetical protein
MQPWAWLIINGYKDIENRSWPTKYRGPVLIHAGKRFDGPNDANEWGWPKIERPEDFYMGGIVGEAEIVDCVSESRSEWFYGPFGFLIRNACPLPFRACRGMLGFFEPDFTPLPEKTAFHKTAPTPRQGTLI